MCMEITVGPEEGTWGSKGRRARSRIRFWGCQDELWSGFGQEIQMCRV